MQSDSKVLDLVYGGVFGTLFPLFLFAARAFERRERVVRRERCVEGLTYGGSEAAGRNKVNASASSDPQPKGVRERRAGHVTAKAMHSVLDPERTLGLPGVWAAARRDGSVRNTRDPRRQPASGKDRAHKTGVESARSRKGVRGARSTDEVRDNRVEGRGPALVASALGVSARAWP